MKLCVFDPSIRDNTGANSHNLGDLVIRASVERELQRAFDGAEALRISTKARLPRGFFRQFKTCEVALVAGTNLLCSRMRRHREWKISLLEALRIRRALLLGVGWWQYQDEPDWYSRRVLRAALSQEGLHSVRDDYTRRRLLGLGFTNVVNTGCPTMWPFVEFDQRSVPSHKSDTLLVMLTDYSRKPELDRRFLELAREKYREIVFWPQGRKDAVYFQQLHPSTRTLEYSLEALNDFLRDGPPCDYIGTRLHGGVHCLFAQRRSLVIEVDNRAAEIARDTGLPTVRRDDFELMRRWMAGPTALNIRMNAAAIEEWRSQFRHAAPNAVAKARPLSPTSLPA